MNLLSETFIKKLLREKNFRPSQKLGQNFLVNRAIRQKIIRAAELKKSDTIIEVGPGLGTLTEALGREAQQVTAVEKDPRLIEILKETLKDFKNIKVIEGDILKIENSKLEIGNSFKVVANLPYYIASPVIRKFLQSPTPPKAMILMVQKEVAQRICSRPAKMNRLAVFAQFYAEPKIIATVSKNCFWPRPKVESAIIKLRVKNKKPKVNPELFFKIVRAGFAQPRKQLANNLSRGLKLAKPEVAAWLGKNNLRPSQRAETLKLEDWINLTKNFIIINDQ